MSNFISKTYAIIKTTIQLIPFLLLLCIPALGGFIVCYFIDEWFIPDVLKINRPLYSPSSERVRVLLCHFSLLIHTIVWIYCVKCLESL